MKDKKWLAHITGLTASGKDVLNRTEQEYATYMQQTLKRNPDPRHGHHIVFKKAIGIDGKVAAYEAKEILLYLGINPYYDHANLAFAPNQGGHGDIIIQKIAEEIRLLYNQNATDPNIVDMIKARLVSIAERWIIRDKSLGF